MTGNDFKYIPILTRMMEEKGSKRLRIRWMIVNRKLSIYFKTARLITRLKTIGNLNK